MTAGTTPAVVQSEAGIGVAQEGAVVQASAAEDSNTKPGLTDEVSSLIVDAQPMVDDSLEASDDAQSAYILSAGSRGLISPVIDNPLSAAILNCTVQQAIGRSCDFNTLPLIGMQTLTPSIDDIMARVVVSHPWMGDRIREMFEILPVELLLLTRALTAIVVSYDIRPSFYRSDTGAIYLDPEGMWLTDLEQAVIDTAPDYRTEFASQLQFIMLWRYVEGNTDIRSLDRNLESISIRTAALLFHELAHANDFYLPDRFDSIDRSLPIMSTIGGTLTSTYLSATYPLSSVLMSQLAEVSFKGRTATVAEGSLTSADITAEFPHDAANDYYNYTNQYEDLAMVFEEAMMYYSFGISRDVGITNLPDTNICENYIVTWGQRNRIADPAVMARSILAIRALLPEIAAQAEDRLADMPLAAHMSAGIDWCSNIALTAAETQLLIKAPVSSTRIVEWLIPYL